MALWPYALLAALIAANGDSSPPSGFGELCVGTERVVVDSQPPRTAPYRLAFSADLKRGRYCWGACGAAETYTISDSRARPIKLADVDRGGEVRRMTFDPAASTLEDYQVIVLGPIHVTRAASATCKPAAFHAPA